MPDGYDTADDTWRFGLRRRAARGGAGACNGGHSRAAGGLGIVTMPDGYD